MWKMHMQTGSTGVIIKMLDWSEEDPRLGHYFTMELPY